MVTHSEIILDAALDTNLTLLLGGRADNLAKKSDIRESLKIYGTAHYIRARQRGYVLYVEGGIDVDILRALALRVGHPAAVAWDENPNVFFVENTHPESSAESELERVEGGFGITPREHFNQLRKLLPGLRGLAILDSDGRGKRDFEDQNLIVRYWSRYEIENYFLTPDILLAFVARHNDSLGLFAVERQIAQSVMDEVVLGHVFGGADKDFQLWRAADPATGRLIWEAKTKTLKLSAIAEAFFRRLRDQSDFEILLSKGEFHRLVDFVDPDTVPREIHEKLDLLSELFRGSAPLLLDSSSLSPSGTSN
jgi:hypothetical protein